MPSLTHFPCFMEHLVKGVHNFSTHAFKVVLTNVAPKAEDTMLADITAIAPTGGYAIAGYLLDGVTVTRVGVLTKIFINDETIAAVAGVIGPFRYAVVYNSSVNGGPLVGHSDYGSSITLKEDELMSLDFDNVLGALNLT